MEKFCQPFHFTSLFYMMCQKVAQCRSKFLDRIKSHRATTTEALELTLSQQNFVTADLTKPRMNFTLHRLFRGQRNFPKARFRSIQILKPSKNTLVTSCLYTRSLSKTKLLLNQRYVSEGLSGISSYFTLHLIKVGKLKRFKQVSSDLKTILTTDLATSGFLSFEKGKSCRSILIMLRGKKALSSK